MNVRLTYHSNEIDVFPIIASLYSMVEKGTRAVDNSVDVRLTGRLTSESLMFSRFLCICKLCKPIIVRKIIIYLKGINRAD